MRQSYNSSIIVFLKPLVFALFPLVSLSSISKNFTLGERYESQLRKILQTKETLLHIFAS